MISNLRHRRSIAGFTLIEMLVVVAIITALLALLTPALGKARATARLAACASNQTQLFKTNSDLMADRFFAFATMGDAIRAQPGGVTADPEDPDPIVLDGAPFGVSQRIPLSFALNGEYNYFKRSLQHITSQDRKVLWYDGLSGLGDGSGTAGVNQPGNHKVNIIHEPPGNTANFQTIAVGASALAAHLAHGDPIGALGNDDTAIARYQMSEFDPRHPVAGGVGNIVYVDGHIDYVREMTGSMFIYGPAPPGNNGNGNGNGNGNN